MRISRTKNCERGDSGGMLPCWGAALGFLAFFCFAFGFAIASDKPGNTLTGFNSPLDYFPPPHELQVRTFLEGAESEITKGGIVIRQAKLQTFHEDGTKEMIVNAPLCFYDYNNHIVSSTGSLQVQTWDENNKHALHLRGENGFYWQQTNSLLIVSNRQSTIISGSMTNSFTP